MNDNINGPVKDIYIDSSDNIYIGGEFTSVDNSGLPLNVQGTAPERGVGAATSRYASWLPEVYAGSPNRLMRYIQYDQMDNDLEINAALDTALLLYQVSLMILFTKI